MTEPRKPTLMQLQFSLPIKIVISSVIMFILLVFVYALNVPNPNMILIAGLVLSSALFGFGGGGVAALIMLGYTLYFFSTDHSFTQFTPDNMMKVMVSLIGIAADMLLVCFLKRAEVQAFTRVDTLTEELNEENEKLQYMSVTDALTGVRNRMALRQDYDSFQGHEVVVMMADLDDFKAVNDTGGHDEGDRILKETGRLLGETFGTSHCYRYGGDEFLVIVPDMSLDEFQGKLNTMLANRPLSSNGAQTGLSVGYVHAVLHDSNSLRTLISVADEKLYVEKRGKKVGRTREFSFEGMRAFLEEMTGQYDVARVVDPIECKILDLKADGTVGLTDTCYGIWKADHRCKNCSSASACRMGCHHMKAERLEGQDYYVQSNPVSIRLKDGSTYNAVVELIDKRAEEPKLTIVG